MLIINYAKKYIYNVDKEINIPKLENGKRTLLQMEVEFELATYSLTQAFMLTPPSH